MFHSLWRAHASSWTWSWRNHKFAYSIPRTDNESSQISNAITYHVKPLCRKLTHLWALSEQCSFNIHLLATFRPVPNQDHLRCPWPVFLRVATRTHKNPLKDTEAGPKGPYPSHLSRLWEKRDQKVDSERGTHKFLGNGMVWPCWHVFTICFILSESVSYRRNVGQDACNLYSKIQ